MRGCPRHPPCERRMVEIAKLYLASGGDHVALVDPEPEDGSQHEPCKKGRRYQQSDSPRWCLRPSEDSYRNFACSTRRRRSTGAIWGDILHFDAPGADAYRLWKQSCAAPDRLWLFKEGDEG